MGYRVAGDNQPAAVTAFVKPKFAVFAGGIIAQLLIVIELLGGVVGLPIGSVDQRRVAKIGKFLRISWPQKRVIYNHIGQSLMQIGLCAHAFFVNHIAALKAVESIGGGNLVGGVCCQKVGKA